MFADCLKYQKQIYSYLDGMLDAEAAALLEEHIKGCADCAALLAEAKALEAGLQGVFAPIEPPADFSARVMASLPVREAAFGAPQTKVLRFPRRAAFAGLGTVAAAFALILGISTMGNNVPVTPIEVVENPPAVTEPAITDSDNNIPVSNNTQIAETLPAAADSKKPNNTAVNNVGTKPEAIVPEKPTPGEGLSLLPQASFGTEAVGSLHIRLLANYDKSDIYGIHASGKSEIGFYTYENQELALWKASVEKAAEPECLSVFTVTDGSQTTEVLRNACATYAVNTVIFSPDKSLQASNVRGENPGLWVSGALIDEPYLLSEDGGGSLLAWSPNGSKLMFTDEAGSLYVGYPLEKQVFKVYDAVVTDVLWFNDNQTIAFLAKESGKTYNSLFTAELP